MTSAEHDHQPDARRQQTSRRRAMRSRSFSQVIGASTRRSSARPFAAPRTISIVPSVTMKGTTRSRVIRTPLTRPQSAPPRRRRRARRRPARRHRSQQQRDHDGGERDDRADGEIDAAGDDDRGHADRRHADDRGLARHELEVAAARRTAAPASAVKTSATSDQAERARRCGRAAHARVMMPRRAAGRRPPSVGVRSARRPGAAGRAGRGDITAMRSQTPSSSGR